MKPKGYLASSPEGSSGPLTCLGRPCSKEVATAVNMCDNIGHVFSKQQRENKHRWSQGTNGACSCYQKKAQEVLAVVKLHPRFHILQGLRNKGKRRASSPGRFWQWIQKNCPMALKGQVGTVPS